MDFGKSSTATDAYSQVYRDIDRLLTLTCNMENSDLALEYQRTELSLMISQNEPITPHVYQTIHDIIRQAKIRYVVSEIPKRPWW